MAALPLLLSQSEGLHPPIRPQPQRPPPPRQAQLAVAHPAELVTCDQTIDAIYRAAYQHELVRTLGMEWAGADRYGNRELQGLPEDLVGWFSKRTDQIDLEVERLEVSGRERTPGWLRWN